VCLGTGFEPGKLNSDGRRLDEPDALKPMAEAFYTSTRSSSTRRFSMMNSGRSGVFLPMKKESNSSLLCRWCRFTGSRRMFSPMKSLNSPAEISPRPLKRAMAIVVSVECEV